MQPPDLDTNMDIDELVPQSEDISPEEREHRRTAIRKFMERKKVAQLTEQLRMRLSYASFKASRGYASLPFSKLDPLVDQEIAARSPSPSISSTFSGASGRAGAGGKKVRGRPSSYTPGMTSQGFAPPVGLGMGMNYRPYPNGTQFGHHSLSASTSPALDHFPPDVHNLPAPGSLYMALFGSTPLGSNGFSPIKHSPTLSHTSAHSTTSRRKRSSGGGTGSVPPPESPRKHRRTAGSASFSHPPRAVRHSSGRALQREAAEAAAILTSFLSSQESGPASPRASQGQQQSQSQSTTLVDGRMSRTSSASSTGHPEESKPNGFSSGALGAPFSDSIGDLKPKAPSTPPRLNTSTSASASMGGGAAMPAMDAAETLVWLATSPSPARPPRNANTSLTSNSTAAGRVLFPPSTPVQAHHTRSQSTPNGIPSSSSSSHTGQAGHGQLGGQGTGTGAGQGTQSTPYGFSFADFVNVSPSPAQPAGFRASGVGGVRVSAEAEKVGAPSSIF